MSNGVEVFEKETKRCGADGFGICDSCCQWSKEQMAEKARNRSPWNAVFQRIDNLTLKLSGNQSLSLKFQHWVRVWSIGDIGVLPMVSNCNISDSCSKLRVENNNNDGDNCDNASLSHKRVHHGPHQQHSQEGDSGKG